MHNELSEPLPLVEKGKYQNIQFDTKLIMIKQNNEQNLISFGNESYLANRDTRNFAQLNLIMQRFDLHEQNMCRIQQDLNERDKKKKKKKKNSLPSRSSADNQRPKSDHICQLSSETLRCQICNSVMKYYFHGGASSMRFSLIDLVYQDYIPIFVKKMDLNGNKYKRFLQLSSLTYLKEWMFYVLDRPTFHAIEDFFAKETPQVPRPLKNYERIVKNEQFDKVHIFGDFENANIGCCCFNKKQNAVQILLKSDTNTKGCLHWFMFSAVAKEPGTVCF